MLLMLILLILLNLVWTNFGLINKLCLTGKQTQAKPAADLSSVTLEYIKVYILDTNIEAHCACVRFFALS